MAKRYWISSAGGNWNDASHWTGGQVPAAADDVAIIQNGAFTVSVNSAVSAASIDFDSPDARFSESATGSIATAGNFELDNGTVSLAGSNSFGQLYVTGGLLQYTSGAALGGNAVVLAGGALRAMASANVNKFLDITGSNFEPIAVDAKTGTTLSAGGGGYSISGTNTELMLNAPTGATANDGTIVWHSNNNGSVNSDTVRVTVAGGILRAGDSAFSTLLSDAVHVLSGATINLNGFSTTAGALEIEAGGTVENTSSTRVTLTFGNSIYGTDGVSGAITGNIAVDVENQAIFEASQSYTGGTTIEGGARLTIEANSQVTINGPIVTFGTFEYADNWDGAASYGAISGPGGVLVEDGTLLLQHVSTYSGGTILTGGVLEVAQANALGSVTNTGGGGVVFDGDTGNRPVLLGLATETLNGTLELDYKSEIAAQTGTTLTLQPEFTNIQPSDPGNQTSDIQIGDAAHAGTVVFEAGTGLNINSGVAIDLLVEGGTLKMGDDSLNTLLGLVQELGIASGAKLDLNGNDLTLDTFVQGLGGAASIVNSSSTAATLTVEVAVQNTAPSGNLNVALTHGSLTLTEPAYTGTTTIDDASTLVLAPLNADWAEASAEAGDLAGGNSSTTISNLPKAATIGLSGDIADAGLMVALVTKQLTLASDINGGGTFDIFGEGRGTTATLTGDNSGFTGALLGQDVVVRINQASGLGSTFSGYDAGLVFQHSLQTATGMQLDGDVSLAAAKGAVATLTGELLLSTLENSNTGSNYSHIALTLGDTTNTGTLVLGNSSVDLATSSGQPLFVDIGGGTLQAGNATALQQLFSLAAATAIAKGATLDLNGFELTPGAFASAGTITNSSATQAELLLNQSVTLGGALTGNIALDVASASVTLIGNAAPKGGTTLSGGTLTIGNGGTTGSLAGAVADNGGLFFNRSTAQTVAGAISGTGIVVQEAHGDVKLSGVNSYSGGTVIDNGAILVTNAASLGTGEVSINDGALIGAATTVLSALTAAANTTTLNGNVEIAAAHGTIFSVRPSHLALNGGTVVFGDSTHDGTVNFGATHTTAPGTVSFEIADGQVNAAGSADVFAVGAMKIDAGATLNVNGLAAALSSLTGAGTLTNTQSGTAAVTLGGATNFSGTLAGAIAIAVNGTAVLSGNESFTGTATLDNHATLTIGGTWSEKLIFASGGRVNLTNPNNFSGTIGGFQAGDTVNLDNIAGASATHSWNAAANKLTITGGGHTDTLKFTPGLSAANFKIVGDGAGGTNVIYQASPQAPVPDALVFSSSNTPAHSNHSDTAIHDAGVVGDIAHPVLGIMDCDVTLLQAHDVAVHGDLWG